MSNAKHDPGALKFRFPTTKLYHFEQGGGEIERLNSRIHDGALLL